VLRKVQRWKRGEEEEGRDLGGVSQLAGTANTTALASRNC